MTSNSLTTTDHSRQVSPLGNGPIEGMEDLGASDYILPRWSLIQPTSRKPGADEHIGQFHRNIDDAFAPFLDVVILKISPNRLLWSGDPSDKRPECFSRDGVHGSLYGACNQCQFNSQVNRALWEERESGAKICGYGYTLVCADAGGEGLSLIGAMGTSVRPIKSLNAQFQAKGRSPFSALVRVEAERQTNDRGKYYVLKPVVQSWLDVEETALWRQRYLSIKGVTVKDIEEAVDEPLADESNF